MGRSLIVRRKGKKGAGPVLRFEGRLVEVHRYTGTEKRGDSWLGLPKEFVGKTSKGGNLTLERGESEDGLLGTISLDKR